MTQKTIYKNRDIYGSLIVTDEYFSAGFFKTRKYKFVAVQSIEDLERDARPIEKLAPTVISLLFVGGAIAVGILNSEGVFCWALLGIFGFVFMLLALSTQKMLDVTIKLMNGEIQQESLPLNERSKEFIIAVNKILAER